MNGKILFILSLFITSGLVLFGGCDDTVGIVNWTPPDTTQRDTTGSDSTELPDSLKREIEDIVLVPVGNFWRGSSYGYYERDETPQKEIRVDSFYIMKYEVTNEQYAQFLSEIDEPATHHHGDMLVGRRSDSYFAIGEYARYPISYANWFDAQAYCDWGGRRLPTEAEWEKAARGGLEGMLYPWGDQAPVCAKGAENGAQFYSCDGETVPVGSFAPNGYGLYDMAGNVWEWTSSLYEDYHYDATDGREDVEASGPRVLRGGSWSYGGNFLRVADRNRYVPYDSDLNFGFRCALSP